MKAGNLRRRVLWLGASMLIAACSSAPPPANINLSGYPPAFRQGYADGCASAGGFMKRDEARFKADVQYAWGWRDGRDICRRRG